MDSFLHQHTFICLSSGFRSSVNEVFALLGRYAALIGSYLPTFRESLSLGLLNH